MTKPEASFLQMWNMCIGLFGVQVVWGLQNANTSRIFQSLGADVHELPILWIAAPITGLLIQPIIGRLSDRTWGRLGRRRPYLFYGAILTALALFLMPNVHSLVAASAALWLLCASINIAMEPFRALVADSLPEKQRTLGFALQVFFLGSGAVLASSLPWMLTHWFGVAAGGEPGTVPQSVGISFYIGGLCLLAAVMWTVFTTREVPPDRFPAGPAAGDGPPRTGPATLMTHGALWMAAGISLVAVAAVAGWEREIYVLAGLAAAYGGLQLVAGRLRRGGRAEIGLLEIVEDIHDMPDALRRLALVQFFTWFGLFAMWIYATPAVAERHFGAADPASLAYGEGAEWVGVLFAGYNGVAAFAAFLLPALAVQLTRRGAHAFCLTLGALGFFGFLLIEDPALLWLPIVGIGLAWASIMSVPYAILSTAVPPQRMGVYMGIHNLFLVIPQLVAATLLGPTVEHLFGGRAIYALALAGVAFLLAALSALAIPRHIPAADQAGLVPRREHT